MAQHVIIGSYGQFTIDSDGRPFGVIPLEYQFIQQIDMKTASSSETGSNDILEVGYWYFENGERKYEPPEASFLLWSKGTPVREVVSGTPQLCCLTDVRLKP